MSAYARVPSSGKLLAHLNLLLMVVGGACLWQGTVMLRNMPKPDDLAKLDRLQMGMSSMLEKLWTGGGAALVAIGGLLWLLAHVAVGAAVNASAGLFVFYALLMVVLCCGEAGYVGWSVTALHAVPAPPDVALRFVHPCLGLIFGLFFPGNYERMQEIKHAAPELVYLTYSVALSLLLLQLMSCVVALCAACSCWSRWHFGFGGASAPPLHLTLNTPHP